MGVAAAEAAEKYLELLVVLGAGVLAFAEPRPQGLLDAVVAVGADVREVISRPVVDVIGDSSWQCR